MDTKQKKAAETTRKRHGQDFFKVIGKKAGESGDKTTGLKGFAQADKLALAGMARYARYRKFVKEYTRKCPGNLIPTFPEYSKEETAFNRLLKK